MGQFTARLTESNLFFGLCNGATHILISINTRKWKPRSGQGFGRQHCHCQNHTLLLGQSALANNWHHYIEYAFLPILPILFMLMLILSRSVAVVMSCGNVLESSSIKSSFSAKKQSKLARQITNSNNDILTTNQNEFGKMTQSNRICGF